MEFQQQELPIPLTSKELIVLSKCLLAALKSEQFNETDKEVIRKMTIRIDRYAERQGAYWEKQSRVTEDDPIQYSRQSGDLRSPMDCPKLNSF